MISYILINVGVYFDVLGYLTQVRLVTISDDEDDRLFPQRCVYCYLRTIN